MTSQTDLYDKLNHGPAFLLLGQQYLTFETGTDPFLTEVFRKYGSADSQRPDYHQILSSEASKSIESSLAWMQEKCKRFSAPLWMETVAEFAWNGLYTSAIDVIWQSSFKSSWREIEPIFTEDKDPLDARSRSKLHCTYLFGAVDQAAAEQRPPLTRNEMRKRHQVAVSLLRRLPRLVTPLGVLVIEGYNLEIDWLPLDDLLAVIDEMQAGQVHIFHADKNYQENADIQFMVSSGKIKLYEESLASFLKKGSDIIALGLQPAEEVEGHQITIAGQNQTIPIALWNQVSRSAIVLHESTGVEPFIDTSAEHQYMEFRDFLAHSGEKPVWTGYNRGFAFKRDFEARLTDLINDKLSKTELGTERPIPIILHGQSGIGKTVALGSIAYRIKSKGEYPVLFIERRPLRPNRHDLDVFIEWMESKGANKTLIIWDGMLDFDQYLDLHEYLTSRGRKVVLVGSAYKPPKQQNNEQASNNNKRPNNKQHKHKQHKNSEGYKAVKALPELSKDEIQRFDEFLKKLNIGEIKQLRERYGANFFVALYRILPPSRSNLQASINSEAADSEEHITKIAKEIASRPNVSLYKRLAYELEKAGFENNATAFPNETREFGNEDLNQIQQMMGLVMVPGRFGMRIPIELLMRSIDYDSPIGPIGIVEILSEIDLFSWLEDSIGNITIGPRHPLEAGLIARTRIGGPKYETEFLTTLIRNIASTDTEIQFAIDLVRSINPPDGTYSPYLPHYLDIAEALEYIREQRSLINPRLMLHETNLLRESAKSPSNEEVSPDELLDRAEAVIKDALTLVDKEGYSYELRSQLLVELASTLGSRAKYLYDTDPKEAEELYKHLKQYLFDARAASRDNFYPIDVLFWTTSDLLKSSNTSIALQLDARAELLNIFEMAELEETFTSLERFQDRKYRLGQITQNAKLSDEAFDELEKQGSTAGFVLRAMQIVGELPQDRVLDDAEVKRVLQAVEFLQQNRSKLRHDGRSMQLLLRYWWLAKARKPIFWGERQSVPFSLDDWKTCFGILSDIQLSEEVYRTPLIKYLLGIALFHLGEFDDSEKFFRELEIDESIRGRRRILRSYLVSTPTGEPKKFSGTVAWINTKENRGQIYIPEIRKNIFFIPSDFRRQDITKGSALNDFHIAFNFIRALVDPASYIIYSERKPKSS